MKANDVNRILRKYKKCPKCGISYKIIKTISLNSI